MVNDGFKFPCQQVAALRSIKEAPCYCVSSAGLTPSLQPTHLCWSQVRKFTTPTRSRPSRHAPYPHTIIMIYTSSFALIFAAAALHTASGYVILPSHHRAGPSVIGTTAPSSITPTHHKVFPPKGPGPQTAARPSATTTAHREKKPKGQHKGKKNGSKSNCGAPHESASAHTGHMITMAHPAGPSSATDPDPPAPPGVPFVGGADSNTATAETATGGKLDQRWEPLFVARIKLFNLIDLHSI
jgi:hypothetical protein